MYGWLIAFPHGCLLQIVRVGLAFPSNCSKCEPQWHIIFKSTVKQIKITNLSVTFNSLFPNLDFNQWKRRYFFRPSVRALVSFIFHETLFVVHQIRQLLVFVSQNLFSFRNKLIDFGVWFCCC